MPEAEPPFDQASTVSPAISISTGQTGSTGDENLGPAAIEFLGGLLDNIRTMLAYVNTAGIAVPEELRGKLDELMKNPVLDRYFKATPPPAPARAWRFPFGRSKEGR